MVQIKGIDTLCEVVRSAVPDERLHFLIVGDGPQSDFVKQQIGSLPNVTLAGWTKDMSRVWIGTDIALLTSRNEGTPTAMIEAMAFGKPFVATNVGGVRDLATGSLCDFEFGTEAANGFLAAPDIKALLGCIQLLTTHPTKASEMGNSGREFVFAQFCCDRLASDMRRLYEQLLARPVIQPVEKPAVHLEA
jgi:glycosyltransferase involved in cell wall biosynthesis